MLHIPREQRSEFLDSIVAMFPEEKREDVITTVNDLADLYEGQDANIMGILYRAAEKKRFDEYAEKLQQHHQEHGNKVSWEGRSFVRGQDNTILRMLLMKEEQIQRGTRPEKDREYHPKVLQTMMKYPAAIREELFFLDCYREIMG